MGTEIEAVRVLVGTNGASFHIAAVKGGGFVVLASDTGDSPVVAVAAGGHGVPDEKNPLWALLRRDLAARMCAKSAPKRLLQAAAGPKSASGASSEARWAKLLEDDVTDDSPPSRSRLLSASSGRASIADVRVGALVQSAWSQMDYRNYGKTSDDDICYNFYTPNHWPCGCVATAGAQVMRYHCYPTAPVVAGSYACAINESPASLTMKGGTYDWSAMTPIPANGCSATSREAIGKLTYDVGVSVGMNYGRDGSSSPGYMLSKRFVDRFQYANAASVIFWNGFPGGGYSYSLDRFKAAVIPNFDAGLPVVLGLSGAGGHVVVGDGYGYSDGDFFIHVNLGWADLDGGNVWYMPPNIDQFTSIESIVYNVYPTGTSGASIISGRVLSSGGLPVAGAMVRADGGGSPVETTSDAKGIYALKVSPGTWSVAAEKDGLFGSSGVTVAACISPDIEDSGVYTSAVRPQIGNVRDNDLTLDEKTLPKYTVTFDLGEHGARTGGGELVQEVEEGHAAVEPAVEAASGWTFTGWDVLFANVTADLTVTAQYEAVAAVASAGAWTADVEGVQKAADCKLVVVLSANYGGCWWSQQAQPIFESSAFRDWAAANGVYLVTSDASRLPAGSTNASDAKAWFSTLYWSVSHPDGYVYYPSIAVARPTDFTKAVGYAVVRNDGEQKVGGVPYDGTAASLIEGLATYLTETPDPPAPTKYTVTFDLGEHGARTGGGKLVQEVEEGHAAVAPAVEAASGWTFAGWDRPFANVTADLTVTAQYEAVVPALERTLPEARIEAFEAGKILFVLSGADWCPYTDIVKNYIQSLGSTFTDDFVLYYCNVDTDTTGMADGVPSYGAFYPVEFAGNWSDGLLAYNSGGVEERVQKVLDDALDAYAQRTPPVGTQYLITYDLQGGYWENAYWHRETFGIPVSYTVTGLPQELPVPRRAGYMFEGWKMDGHVINVMPRGTSGHVLLTATWRPATADDYVWSYVIENGEAIIYAEEYGYDLVVSPPPAGDVVVPSELGGCPVTELRGWVFYNQFDSVTSVTIPASIRKIDEMAFCNFCGQSINVDEGNAWYSSDDGVLYDKNKTVLLRCPMGKTSVAIPSSVVEIGICGFSDCFCLNEILLPSGLKKIGESAFYQCSGLTNMSLPEGLLSIGYNAFVINYSDLSLTIPSSVVEIGDDAFGSNNNMSIEVAAGNERYATVDGMLYDNFEKRLMWCPRYKRSAVVPEGTLAIDGDAFGFCMVTNVSLPKSLAEIRDGAFYCSCIESIEIPSSVVCLGNAFGGCSLLHDVYFNGDSPLRGDSYCMFFETPESLTCHVREGSVGWKEPGSAELPDAWPVGDEYARRIVRWEGEPPMTYTVTFDLGEHGIRTGGGELEQTVVGGTAATVPTVSVASGYELAGWDPAPDCVTADTTIRALYKRTGALEPGHYAVETNGYTWSFTVADRGVTIESGKEGWQRAVEPAPVGAVEIPSELGGWPVTEIGFCAFAYCSQMTAVTIPSSVTNLVGYAFAYCGGLRAVTIPASVTAIGCAFYGCDSLRALAFDGNEPRYLGYGTACAPTSAAVLVREESEGWRDGDDLIATWPRDVEAPCPVRLWSGTMAKGDIVYELGQGGENAADNPDFYIDALLPQKLSAPTREGYAFAGWMLDGHEVTEIPVGATGDIVLTAQWEEVPAEPGWGWSDGVRQWRYVTVEYNDNGTTKTGAKISNDGLCAVSPRPQGALAVPSKIDGYPVVELDAFAFADCTGLTSVVLPACFVGDGLTARAFAGCDDLTSVSVAGGGSTGLYNVRNGLLLYRDDWLVLCPPGLADPVIPETVLVLEWAAFYENRKMTRIEIPAKIDAIPDECFAGCANLSEIVCPATVVTYDGNPFEGTAWAVAQGDFTVMNGVLLGYRGKQADVVVPDTVRRVNDGAFQFCRDLVSVELPSSVKQIGGFAFGYCDSLVRLTGGEGLVRIEENALWGTALRETAPEGLLTVCDWVVGYKGEVPEELVISADVRGIADAAFAGSANLKTVTYLGDPSGVVIGRGAFEDTPYEAAKCPFLDSPIEAKSLAQSSGKLLFVLSGADWCPWTTVVKQYLRWLCDSFFDRFVVYYCNVDTDTHNMADGVPSYGAFDPAKFKVNWHDGRLAYDSGGVEERVQKVIDDALAAYGEPPVVNYYTVQFDANGGSGTMAAQSFACGQAQALSRNAFSWEGRAFAGWALSAGGEVAYANGAVVSDLTAEPNGVVTLYAVWVENSAGRLYGDADKSVSGGEKPPYASAAAVYDGYLYEGETVIGSVQVKIAKGKVDKKSGVFSAKVTATVQLAGETKKLSFKNGIADATGLVTAMTDKNGNELAVSVGVNGLGGTFRRAEDNATGLVDGARNVFSGKSTADKQAAAMASWLYQGTYNVALDGGTLSVTVDKKGKAKVSGTIDGTVVSATSQLLVGDGMAAIPVVIVKKVALSFLLWLSADGTAELGGATGVVGVPGRIEGGSTFGFDADEFAGLFGGLYADCLPNGMSVVQNGTKWIVADGAKAGKLVLLDKATGELDLVKSKLTGNTSGLKLTYKEKDGTFTGSFKVYNFENGKIKSYTASVKGVLIGEVGYGTATISKAGRVKVWIVSHPTPNREGRGGHRPDASLCGRSLRPRPREGHDPPPHPLPVQGHCPRLAGGDRAVKSMVDVFKFNSEPKWRA